MASWGLPSANLRRMTDTLASDDLDPLGTGFLIIAIMLLAIGVGIPVAISVGVTAFFGMWILIDLNFAMAMFRTLPYAFAAKYEFVVVPMFVLMGAFIARAGISSELYTAANRWVGGIRGALFYATTIAAAGFAAISSSTVVASAVFARMALPDMIKLGIKPGAAAASICAAGTFAAIIPPSIGLVLYALLTNQSVGKLFMAGIVPGLLTVAVYVVGIRVFLKIWPEWAQEMTESFTLTEKLGSLKGLWAFFVLLILVLGGIYSGVMPPSTAGTIGAAGALAICLIRKRLSRNSVLEAFFEAVTVSSALFLIVVSGLLLSRLMAAVGFVPELVSFLNDFEHSQTEILILIVLVYLLLGMFIDTVSMLVMTLPVVFPITTAAGIDPIWFGIIIIKTVEIGAISPPIGLNLFAVQSASKGLVKTKELYACIYPFIVLDILVLILIISLPELVLWLPSAMSN